MRGKPYRPRLDLPYSHAERVAQSVLLLGIATAIALTGLLWPSLPERVPTHFGFSGAPDAWGAKSSMLLLPLLTLVMGPGFALLARVPHWYNYPVTITAENAPRQYRLARTMMLWLGAEVVWIFTALTWGTARVAAGQSAGLGVWPMVALTVLPFGTLIPFLVAALRAR
jgi:hypothetical protein